MKVHTGGGMEKAPINWMNSTFLTLTPLAAIILIPYYGLNYGFTLYEWGWFAFYMCATGMSITAGYHRLWSHKAYKGHFVVRLFFAIWGACSCQNSILAWSSDHRKHHRFTDDPDQDPYSASRGFWFSHMGWILRDYRSAGIDQSNAKDLMRDPIVRWQHRHYLTIAIVTNGVIPLLLGMLHGRLFGTLLLAFLLRVVLNHHFTFFINSLAHIWGSRPYSDANSSRDNGFLAMFTYGEGYHNFHHSFQHDYRNGIRWWHFDPSKWFIRAGTWVGLTRDLKMASKARIERARVNMQLKAALAKLEHGGEAALLRDNLERTYQQFVAALNEWPRVRSQWLRIKKASLTNRIEKLEFSKKYFEMKYQLKMQRQQWRLLLAELAAV
jgi:stearoyl-CoA desaturase (delta-9 desaturase)